jgi:hypothetical protein
MQGEQTELADITRYSSYSFDLGLQQLDNLKIIWRLMKLCTSACGNGHLLTNVISFIFKQLTEV